MIKLTDLNEAIERQGAWSEIGWMDKGEKFAIILDDQAVLVEKIDNSRLGEGATDIWVVIKIGDRLFKKTGYHRSHDGTYWDGSVTEVRARETTITVYDKI